MNNQVDTVQTSSEIEFPILDVIQNRRSRRSFLPKPVEEYKIKQLFEAARWAPSSVNEQPWMYIYAMHDQPLWKKIYEALHDGNKIWVRNAPLLVVSMARKEFSRNGRLNLAAKYDLGGANAFISLQATELDLNVHQMGGFDSQVMRGNLNIPDSLELGVVLAIGYLDAPDKLPENLEMREIGPRHRILQKEFVMNKSF